MLKLTNIIGITIVILFGLPLQAAPISFEKAKIESKRKVYFDRNDDGDFYCGCDWNWVGRSGGRTILDQCGYKVRAQHTRAERIEYEHVMPAHAFANQRQCWQNGGRKNCKASDPLFNIMESDLHNLVPALGEVNADRSNYRYAVLVGEATQYGACDAETDFKGRKFEPREEVRGQIARVYFYMHDHYNLKMSSQQEKLFIAWNATFPVSHWEKERDQRIALVMGHSNPFVTGAKHWSRGHKNSGAGLLSTKRQTQKLPVQPVNLSAAKIKSLASDEIRGNRNSFIYHLPEGCPSYNKVGYKNRVVFRSASEAKAAGYRKAGNCK